MMQQKSNTWCYLILDMSSVQKLISAKSVLELHKMVVAVQ